MSDALLTADRVAVESTLLDAMTEARVVDVISHMDDDGHSVTVEQIGLQLGDGTILYLCAEEPILLTTVDLDADDDEVDIFDPLVWHRGRC